MKEIKSLSMVYGIFLWFLWFIHVVDALKISTIIWQTCSAKEVCIGVLEQLDSESTFHLEKFIVLLDTLKTGKSNSW